ncbi:hypothetical protein SIN8267_01301 [Sinobacterium norvegicum]|uniref:Lipoprotein n=1 Tax=Sinobacterium norvegicum TaxID=1641715 RepID=A0ABN8EFK2_9GAMM|nr:META domain-containing protein [Sinobacterium norvegicum]CAH0991199.1 hypothetical protein SIN8267_01301 [Sinobacterium norvegicum]
MNHYFTAILLAATTVLLTACDSDSNSDNSPAASAVELANSGLYTGTIQRDNGDVALIRGYLAASGEAVITIEADDSEQATHIVHGNVDENYLLSGEITDGTTSETVSIALTATSEQLNTSIDSSLFSGDLSSLLQAGTASASLDTVSGQFSRIDGDDRTTLSIDADGSFSLSGPCQDSGTIAVIDSAINLYSVTTEQSCGQLGLLATLDSIEVDNDVLRLVGPLGEVDYFRL